MTGPPLLYGPADLDVMCRTLHGEARGEPYAGQVAVAWVIRNRASRAPYAHDLLGAAGAVQRVCQAPWQFSCWNADDPNRAKILALGDADLAPLRAIALGVLSGEIADPTQGSDLYYAPAGMGGVEPYWASKVHFVGVIGNQRFYNSQVAPP